MNKQAKEVICGECGKKFIYRTSISKKGMPRICLNCYNKIREKQNEDAKELENRKWQLQEEKEYKQYELDLKKWNLVEMKEIQPIPNHVLYIIGNGFDLMHGVPSSYYSFRDSLGKRSSLRVMLENFINKENIWADFEESLAHFNIKAMSNQDFVDDCLDTHGAYDQDASAADYFLAMEMAANPISTVSYELPRRFRKWIESLKVNTVDRPLQDLICSGKVLCFNYTEFIESLYGVSETDICYIHGCRRKKKGQPKEELILGHMVDASVAEYDFYDKPSKSHDVYKKAMIEDAQEVVLRLITEHDDALTKNSRNIILSKIKFFEELEDMKQVIVIGHSLSEVDIDYFIEITKHMQNRDQVQWYFGCHGLRDLNNLPQLLRRLGLLSTNVMVFRTECVRTTPLKSIEKPTENEVSNKAFDLAGSDKWIAKRKGKLLVIENKKNNSLEYEVVLSGIRNAFFVNDDKYLLVIIEGIHAGILLWGVDEHDNWNLIDELETISNQNLINPRLQHVYIESDILIFVYNNRVRRYSLKSGELVENRAMRNAQWSGDGASVEIFIKSQESVHV